jgi:hypothetical protein
MWLPTKLQSKTTLPIEKAAHALWQGWLFYAFVSTARFNISDIVSIKTAKTVRYIG